jgi:hypothetical protein
VADWRNDSEVCASPVMAAMRAMPTMISASVSAGIAWFRLLTAAVKLAGVSVS